jgi:hypothetical protein
VNKKDRYLSYSCIVSVVFFVVAGKILNRNANGIESTQVRCFTDKSVYMQGECVISSLSNAASSEVSVIDRKYIDGGFASIEIENMTGHGVRLSY